MAVIGSSTPSVQISVPVPQPVKPRPKAPARPKPATQPQPTPRQPMIQPRKPVDDWQAVILPWTPGAKRMARLPRRVVKYSRPEDHQAFHSKIMEDPREDTPPLVYADWLEENGKPVLAEFIRTAVARKKAPWYGTTNVMKYTHVPREEHAAKSHNTVFVYEGLGRFREPLRDRIGRVRKRPTPTLQVSVQSPYSEADQGYLSFNMDVPVSEGENWVKRLLTEGHPAGNRGAERRRPFTTPETPQE